MHLDSVIFSFVGALIGDAIFDVYLYRQYPGPRSFAASTLVGLIDIMPFSLLICPLYSIRSYPFRSLIARR